MKLGTGVRRSLGVVVALAFAASLFAGTGSAQAAFGAREFDLQFLNQDGSPDTQAGSHPFSVVNTLTFNTESAEGFEYPDQMVKDITVKLPEGLVGRPTATPRCSGAEFIDFDQHTKIPGCSNASAVGTILVKTVNRIGELPAYVSAPVYNLIPPPGVIQKFGFNAFGVPVAIEFILSEQPPYEVEARLRGIAQPLPVLGSVLTVWGDPASPVHDRERGSCVHVTLGGDKLETTGEACPAGTGKASAGAFLTLPRACLGPLTTHYEMDSWQSPGLWTGGEVETHDNGAPPSPAGLLGCGNLGFNPSIAASPTTKAANSPTGLDFALDISDEGLTSPVGNATSDVRKAEVTLPRGFSINPSQAEGLNVCSEADLARETSTSEPGEGCPNESKIGTLEVETPLLDETIKGSLFVATPYENPEHSLVALYMVLQNEELGISVHLPLRVEPDGSTGQLTTVAEELPQLPFSHFRLRFREGTRSPLASPAGCGSYAANATLYPWAGGAPTETSSKFQIIVGPESGPCPSGGDLPFHPGLIAGSINNAAGAYSPFNVRIFRNDSEQEITRFSLKLPPGVSGKLAGIPFCPEAGIAAAKARERERHGGQEELDRASCPAASEVGRTLVGAGVGPSLTYVPGKVYLAGPYHGASLSVVAITAAKAGPFDLGTVVVREALRVNPETAEVFVDATGSDPIPHIINGIPVDLRDIRVYVDRPQFALNPTSCEPTSTASTIVGSGTDFASETDDRPVTVTTRFQTASCASLGFEPKLTIALKGGTKRSANPSLKAVVTPRKGDANIGQAIVALPRSEFLEQAHIKTICTRVQFNAGGGNGERCPAASIYGRAKAVTPLLEAPLSGPVFLRSSNHQLPDLVAALHSPEINIDLVGRIDSAKGGGIRTSFEAVPDAPVTKFTLEMFGGKKSLLVNSTNLCKGTHRATAEFIGQNGKPYALKPALRAQCGGKKGRKSGKKQKKVEGKASLARFATLWGW